MNQRAGFGPLQARGRPKGRIQRQSSSGREALNSYKSFPYFLLHWKKEGDASLFHVFTSCFYVENHHHASHTYCAITSNEPFYLPSNVSLNHISTSPTHTHKQQGSELAGNLMRQALTRISCFWFSQTYCNNRHSRSILAPLLLAQAKTQECKWKKHFLIFRILK